MSPGLRSAAGDRALGTPSVPLVSVLRNVQRSTFMTTSQVYTSGVDVDVEDARAATPCIRNTNSGKH